MLQNKIYLNFLVEILKTFLIILIGLSLIALTVRAVNFLDLIVENGYNLGTYFNYSFLNLFGVIVKFFPLSFLIALIIFTIKHKQEGEFTILWTSGVKKIHIANLVFFISLIILCLYLLLSNFLTPIALNKSRQLLSESNFNSFLPTVKAQQFSDSFKGFTFIVEEKKGNQIKNIFLHDKNNNLRSLSTNSSKLSETSILAKSGIIESKKLILFNGQIISSKKNLENEIIKFEQLFIDLDDLNTNTIKKTKIQETSTLGLLKCFVKNNQKYTYCNENFKKEILATLNRRITMSFYIPVISLFCALILVKSKKFYFSPSFIFVYGIILLIFTEIAVRYTGINKIIFFTYLLSPIILILTFYFYLIFNFSNESKNK